MIRLFLRENSVLFAKLIIAIILLIPGRLYAQGISNLWLMGYSSGTIYTQYGGTKLNFFNGYPDTMKENRSMNFSECNANISDSTGNLLFYANGAYIANANNDTMLNGDSLNPSDYTDQFSDYGLRIWQGNLILPLPGQSTIYYLFHETVYYIPNIGEYRPLELYFSVIDMSQDNGLGAVIQKNVVLLSDTLTIGAITACKHANGRDWWIVFHKNTGRTYYKYLLSPQGLAGPYPQDIGSGIIAFDWLWQSCFSPNGKKFATVRNKDTLDIMDFDRCSGMFSNSISIVINDSANARGLAFSKNSQFLYVSSAKYLYQYDINANNIDSNRVTIAEYDGFVDPNLPFRTGFFLAQIANDEKIYVSTINGTQWLHVINNPDNLGLSCNLVQHSFLLPTINFNTIPNFPNFFLGSEAGTICDSLSSAIKVVMEEKGISVFPNPACTHLTFSFSFPSNPDFKLHIYTNTMQLINSENLRLNEVLKKINIDSYTPGLYIYTIVQNDQVISTGKFSVIR